MILTLGPENLSVDFEFTVPEYDYRNLPVKKVGVMMSGGLDSAALMCIIITELRNTKRLENTELHAFTVTKTDAASYYSNRVREKIEDFFDVSILHHNNIENTPWGLEIGRVPFETLVRTHVRHRDVLLYGAFNKMAPDNIRPFDATLKVKYPEHHKFYQLPFLNLHKPQLVDIYYKLGCEEIMPYAHSCAGGPLGYCMMCYNCQERKWAFDMLGKIDPGTISPDVEDLSFNNTWQITTQ